MKEEERNLEEEIKCQKAKIEALESALEVQKRIGCLADANEIGGTTVVCTKTLRNLLNHNEELVQAKEIIKEWLQWANDDTESPKFQEIVNQSEQFLGGAKL